MSDKVVAYEAGLEVRDELGCQWNNPGVQQPSEHFAIGIDQRNGLPVGQVSEVSFLGNQGNTCLLPR